MSVQPSAEQPAPVRPTVTRAPRLSWLGIREEVPAWQRWGLGVIPVAILFAFSQRFVIESIAFSGIKG